MGGKSALPLTGVLRATPSDVTKELEALAGITCRGWGGPELRTIGFDEGSPLGGSFSGESLFHKSEKRNSP